mgnify:CR=1 FL=1
MTWLRKPKRKLLCLKNNLPPRNAEDDRFVQLLLIVILLLDPERKKSWYGDESSHGETKRESRWKSG